jgi:HEAT repeat protein
MPSKEALHQLDALRAGPAADRRKVAESLGGHADAAALLAKLAQDPDPAVRAAATWSLGEVGGAGDAPQLAAAFADPDATVASNAVAALGRLSARVSDPAARDKLVHVPVCSALRDARPYVRANALATLRLDGARCAGASELLTSDPSDTVRAAAADYLRTIGSTDPAIVKQLARCATDDPDASVAERCDLRRTSPAAVPPGRTFTHDLVVFVLPDGRDLPVSGAPFTLVLPDGMLRTGIADRRGAIFERGIPEGAVELGVPAALAQ